MVSRQEWSGVAEMRDEPITESFKTLHRLSREWYFLYDDLVDLEERIQFLHEVCEKLCNAFGDDSRISTVHSIEYLASRTRVLRRWVGNYNARTKIRIDLFFNLAIQNDNRVNLEVASMTKDIAEKTRNDSSSMITIAALTMLFPSGTFVSVSL